jgi:hypothetical protein
MARPAGELRQAKPTASRGVASTAQHRLTSARERRSRFHRNAHPAVQASFRTSSLREAFYKTDLPDYSFTPYFENRIMRQRPYLTKGMCVRILESPIRVESQEGGRFRFWGRVEELGGRYLPVITLSDRPIIQNAFLDRGFRP